MAILSVSISSAQVTIGSGDLVDSNSGFSTPISNYYASSLSQTIYLASEINASGDITGVEFFLNGTTALNNSNDMINVWIGHTSQSAYTPVVGPNGAQWISISGHSQVLANGSLVQTGSTVRFNFSTPFPYNGTDNLVITVDANELGDDGSDILFYQFSSAPAIRSFMIRADDAIANADPMNPPQNYTGSFETVSVQGKTTRPIITLLGISALGVAENTAAKVVMYPNPVVADLLIKSEVPVISADIHTITGQLVQSGKVEGNKIAANSLVAGVYLATVHLEDGTTFTEKFVKQ